LRRIDAKAAQLDEALQRLSTTGVEQVAQRIDVDLAILLYRPLVADLGGAMEDVVNALDSTAQRVGVRQVAAHDRGNFVEQGGVSAGPHQGPHVKAARCAGLGEVAADESRGAGDQTGYRHGS